MLSVGAPADQRQLLELSQRRRRVAVGERRVGRDEQDVRVAEELDPVEGAFLERELAEREVELAPLDRLDELRVLHRLHQPDADEREALLEVTEQSGEEPRAHALEDPHAKRPRLAREQRGHVRLGGGEPGHDRVGVTAQQAARVGERDRARPAGPLDELRADDLLEPGDLLADRRLRVAELDRSAPEGALALDGLQRREVPQLYPKPSTISFSDHIQ